MVTSRVMLDLLIDTYRRGLEEWREGGKEEGREGYVLGVASTTFAS